MKLDIRMPIGLLFLGLGIILVIYGGVTWGNEMYAKHSLGINVNLFWGIVMTVFGAIMLALSRIGRPPVTDDDAQRGFEPVVPPAADGPRRAGH